MKKTVINKPPQAHARGVLYICAAEKRLVLKGKSRFMIFFQAYQARFSGFLIVTQTHECALSLSLSLSLIRLWNHSCNNIFSSLHGFDIACVCFTLIQLKTWMSCFHQLYVGHITISTFDLDIALSGIDSWVDGGMPSHTNGFCGGSRDRETEAISTESEVWKYCSQSYPVCM